MEINIIKNKLFNGLNLTIEESSKIFELIMSGQTSEIDTTAILIGLKIKKESKDEILGAAKILREKSLKIKSPTNCIDTCGTGGDMKGTLNISTAASIVAASAGAIVAKHGNRSISSKSGSADFIEKIGLKITSDTKILENSLNKNRFCFLFAQYHHDAMKHVIKIRQQLKTRTIFNLLGPLINPANTKRQLLGVFEKKWVNIHCEVLKNLGSTNVMVVHGIDGMDEISLSSPTLVSELNDGNIKNYTFNPKDYGYDLINIEEIKGGDADYNAKSFIDLLEGPNNSFQKIVEINSGAAIYLSGITNSLKDGFEISKSFINNGKTKEFFLNLINSQ
tara:strand:- start:7385 stop:8389 length:1005 start_codon:yes stop_codon:yes gene_type:complete